MGVSRGSLGTKGEEEAAQEESTTVGVTAEPGVGDSVGLVEGRAPGGEGAGEEGGRKPWPGFPFLLKDV